MKKNILFHTIDFGVFWSVMNILIFLSVWYIIPNFISSVSFTLLKMFSNLTVSVFICFRLRKIQGGCWDFAHALPPIALTFITNTVIVFFFTYCFGRYIDKSYPNYMLEQSVSFLLKKYQSMGMIQEDLSFLKHKLEKSMYDKFYPTFMVALKRLIYALATQFAFALVFAVIFTRKPNVNEK